MIPAYNTPVAQPKLGEDLTKQPIDQQIRVLQEQMVQLRESIEFINRDRVRLKNEVDQLKAQLNKR